MKTVSLDDFYEDINSGSEKGINELLPKGIRKEIGHFNVFDIKELSRRKQGNAMPYDRRSYYKISVINGHNRAEYADKVIEIPKYALLFATPNIPYHWLPQDNEQSGHFCVFTDEFLFPSNRTALDEMPIFKAGGYPVFQLGDAEFTELEAIFKKMHKELLTDYAFKYDLLRNYVMEVIHFGQKLQPATALYPAHSASARVSSLFAELLERQFPIESPNQKLMLRTAGDFAERLSVHVNHLNKVVKENTGNTTSTLISSRIIKEAKILLKQTNWNISEIAYTLGFEELAHFSNFFRKQTNLSPVAFRS
jgi:AraC family transcriptional activator of pobA